MGRLGGFRWRSHIRHNQDWPGILESAGVLVDMRQRLNRPLSGIYPRSAHLPRFQACLVGAHCYSRGICFWRYL